MKLYTAVIYEWVKKARSFVPEKRFQPSIVFAGEAGVSKKGLRWGRLWPNKQTLY
jgi:hypothetical protein